MSLMNVFVRCLGLLKCYGPDHGDANDCKGFMIIVILVNFINVCLMVMMIFSLK